MTPYGILFYVLAAMILVCTGLAITRRHPIHAIVYLVASFFGSALLFYLLGAPLLAAFEVIIYAGAVMVLFLFVVMMLRLGKEDLRPLSLKQWAPAVVIGLLFLTVAALMAFTDPRAAAILEMAVAAPSDFGRTVFHKFWLPVEVISLLLLVALVGAILLGKEKLKKDENMNAGVGES